MASQPYEELPKTQRHTLEQCMRIAQMAADISRKQQELKIAPWTIGMTIKASGTALFAAALAVLKFMIDLTRSPDRRAA